MKTYWHIPGYKDVPLGIKCISSQKIDGSNIRCEWNFKSGWYKFGSREVLIDKYSPLGPAIDIFLNTYGDSLPKVFKDKYKGFQSFLVFCEYFGPNSFAGQHVDTDKKEVVLFDVNVHKKGIVPPQKFLEDFGHLKIPNVVYNGLFTMDFINDVKQGKYGDGEGVVAKGTMPGKSEQHSIWFAKVKTNAWMDKLKQFAQNNTSLQQILNENIKEQNNG